MNQDIPHSISSEVVRQFLHERDFQNLRKITKDTEVVDIAELFSELTIPESITLFRCVTKKRRPDLFAHLNLETQEELIEELPDILLASLLNEMEPDKRTRLLEEIPEGLKVRILAILNPLERQIASALLSYPENSVGRMMTPDFLTLNPTMTVSQALSYIHWSKALPDDYLHHLFVTEESGKLIGEVSLASLVVCDPPSLSISEVMQRARIYLYSNDHESHAVKVFRKYDRNYIPVVDMEDKLLGLVTSDDLFDVAEEEATEDIQQFGGHGALENPYFETPFFTMFRKRAGWLAFLFICGFISCEALKAYHEDLAKWGFLFFFLPIITSSGGNSGTQAASLIIRGLAIQEMTLQDSWRILGREILIGLSLGVMLAIFGFIRVSTWGLGSTAGIVVSASVISVVSVGVLLGSMLPFIFKILRLDPAVVSSPVISTSMDALGILIFVHIAKFFLA